MLPKNKRSKMSFNFVLFCFVSQPTEGISIFMYSLYLQDFQKLVTFEFA